MKTQANTADYNIDITFPLSSYPWFNWQKGRNFKIIFPVPYRRLVFHTEILIAVSGQSDTLPAAPVRQTTSKPQFTSNGRYRPDGRCGLANPLDDGKKFKNFNKFYQT